MNKQYRQQLLKKIAKETEQRNALKKISQEIDINAAMDADAYSELIFSKLLENIKIEGIED